MPKGVEHCSVPVSPTKEADVRKSVMPKGVEHILALSLVHGVTCAEICDAERR